MSLKTVNIQYYASFKDLTNKSQETLKTHVNTTSELYKKLKDKYKLQLDQNVVRVAVNEEFSTWDQLLNDGDFIVFLPPVAGG